MILETERLFLKSPHAVTAEAVCRYYLRNRDFLANFSPIRDDDFFTQAFQQTRLEQQITDWQEKHGFRFFLATKEDPEEVIGSISLSNIVMGGFRSCFMGYQLDERQCHRGYMTEAVKRVITFAFEDVQLHRVEANIMPRNTASIAVAERCGFEMEGLSKKYIQINGIWEDHAHYVVLNAALES